MINCAICGSTEILFSNCLVDYPLTNLYLEAPCINKEYRFDLEVFQCRCGHVQARSAFDSNQVYTIDYPYNGSATGVMARREKGVLLIKKHVGCARLNAVVDIGCGQLEMIHLIRKHFSSERMIGLDPVPLRKELAALGDIEFYNQYFTGANFTLSRRPDPSLFILDNVLEHVVDPNLFVSNLDSTTHDGDFIYVCVPSCECMFMKLQFQELIHEHLQYFSIPVLNALFNKFGFKTIEARCDYSGARGYNYLLYQKSSDQKQGDSQPFMEWSLEDAYGIYASMLQLTLNQVGSIRADIWGVCASELTPTLAYHMRSDLSFCKGILDTSANKLNRYMPGIRPQIIDMECVNTIPPESYFFITAPAVGRQVVSNLHNRGMSNMIMPITFF